MASDGKGSKKELYKYINSKSKTKENVCLQLKGAEELVTQDTENTEVFSTTFPPVYTSRTGLQKFKHLKTRGKLWINEDLTSVEENKARALTLEHLNKLDIHTFIGPDK